MKRGFANLFVAVLPIVSFAQERAPDAAFRVDVNFNNNIASGKGNRFRWYDPLGRHSTVGFGLNLESGYYVLVTERLQRISNDHDRDQLDEVYIEEPGLWRVGRQYLPFGSQIIIRESGMAIKVEASRVGQKFPLTMAVVDSGPKQSKGAVGRLGPANYGLSLAYGQHFARSSTSLAVVSNVEDLRPGEGYRLIVGGDGTIRLKTLDIHLEHVLLRRGNTAADLAMDVSDLKLTPRSSGGTKFSIAWSREWVTKVDLYRVESEVPISKNLSMRSLVRFQRGSWKDLSIGIRVRL